MVDVTPLNVPLLDHDTDVMTAALDYAAAGFYVVPIRKGTKNPGTVLGKDWQHQSSRDVDQIVAWLAGTDHGIALHVGRSGAVVFDIDTPDKVPEVLSSAVAGVPFQSTRDDDGGRGHAVFAVPPGRRFGNGAGRLGSGWGEVRGTNGVIMVAPSVHPDGGVYRWARAGTVPVLPPDLAELLPDGGISDDAATDAEVLSFFERHTTGDRPELLTAVVRGFEREVTAGASRHQSMVAAACWAMRESQAGFYDATDAARALKTAFLTALSTESGRRPTSEFGGILAWAIGQAGSDDPGVRRQAVELRRPYVGVLLDQHVEQVQTWQYMPNTMPLLTALAVAVTALDDEGEPAWVLIVAVPSSGKTEMVSMLSDAAAAHLDNVTVAGLLSWSRGKAPQPVGLLTRVESGLVTFGDLSTLLATSDKGGRDEVFSLLRRVYDGKVNRDVGAPSGAGTDRSLSWAGRLSVVGAVTGAIDSYSVHSTSLGDRWLYVRLADLDTAGKRAVAGMARRGRLAENRTTARAKAAEIVRAARLHLPSVVVSDAVAQAIEDAAMVCCWGRASVPRHGYGRREIDGLATIEEPPRVVRQLTTLARGFLALGLDDDTTATLCRAVALDSMPAARRAILDVLPPGPCENGTTAAIAREAGLHRHVARRTLEELEVIGVVQANRPGAEPEDDDTPDRRAAQWYLAGDEGRLIAQVIDVARKEGAP